jgi:tetratricopeptide (TPR) repeat protein
MIQIGDEEQAMKFVAYYRVSTAKQGRSGLGLEAQRSSVQAYVRDGQIVSEYKEVESGKRNDRPKLAQAIEHARREGATLIIAKLDRACQIGRVHLRIERQWRKVHRLRQRLSGADEQRLTKTYTANPEAYQLYLKGHYHVLKLTPPEIQTGISYFEQAIDIDPSYALAYVGLADAYRSALSSDTPPAEFLPKAKVAAQKAIGIEDTLADAHAELGFIIFWYDWDWNAAENQFKRALELDPNDADTHLFYAHLLSNIGRHAEGLAEVKRARELEPLNLRTSALEGQFLIHAGRTDEALASLQRIIELQPNFAFAHLFASSAYIEKGMFADAIAEARKATELNGANSHSVAFLGYALAKSGKTAEARAELEGLLKRSTERYVPPYYIALVYNGLGARAETLAWMERGYKERDAKMVFLKVEPKWNNLRSDPRFQDLERRVGFPQ